MINIKEICYEALKEKNLDNQEEYLKRFEYEIKEIEAKDMQDYFLDLYNKKEKYENENNLLTPYLLSICDDFDISKEPATVDQGDFPDCDLDFNDEVRKYLKEKYSREQFGAEYVCNIASYTTFGLRSALIDMARVFGE